MKGENIATRLLVFGAGVVRLCRRLPDDASARHIARQLVRAATGGGANYEEARLHLLPQRVWDFGELGLHSPRRSQPIRPSNQQRPNRE